MSTTTSRLLNAGFAPFDLTAMPWLPLMPNAVRIEERLDGQRYVLRAEVPGVDATNDVTVTCRNGALRLQIKRVDQREDKTHSEFRYGAYGRTVALPTGVDEDSLHAAYRDGILEITAMLADPTVEVRTIPIAVEDGVKTHGGNTAKR